MCRHIVPRKVKQSRGNVLPRFCFTLGGREQYGYMLAETVDVNIDLLQQLYLYVMKELLKNFKLVYRQFQQLIFHCKYRDNCLNS